MRYLPGAAALTATLCLFLVLGLNPAARVVWIGVGAGLLWLALPPHQYNWWAHVGLALFAGLAAVALLQDGALLWAIAALWAALVAWDISALAETGTQADIEALGRLLRAAGLAQRHPPADAGRGALALQVTFTLTLPWALLLGLTLVLPAAARGARVVQMSG
ncbi:MAG: hypothetical protein H6644_03040 [Caldilineaceae bacterium]|nr:hypothetical protein [Caldilineaceae bacterium]